MAMLFARGGYATNAFGSTPPSFAASKSHGPVFEAELTFEARRGRQADPLRLGRRRRPLRRAGGALSRRAGSGDRLLDRNFAPAGGAAGDRQSDRRRRGEARAGRRRSCSIATTWPTTSGWSRLYARRVSPPSSISAPPASTPSSNTPTGAAACARSSRARTSATRRAAAQVVIRDLRLGAELAKASKDRADHLELRQQRAVRGRRGGDGRAGARNSRAPLRRVGALNGLA